jgi:hypothetical protein
MFRRISFTASLIALAPAATFVAKAQQGTAAITGVVTDQSVAVIPGATVILRNPHTGVVLKATTAGIVGGQLSSSEEGGGCQFHKMALDERGD